MSASAEQYYTRLKGRNSPEDIDTWDREIQQAENDRLGDPHGKMMDILLARLPQSSAGEGPPIPAEAHKPEEKWIQLGIDIQTRQ